MTLTKKIKIIIHLVSVARGKIPLFTVPDKNVLNMIYLIVLNAIYF